MVHANLLLAGNHQMTVGQHVDHSGGDGASEIVAATRRTGALEVVLAIDSHAQRICECLSSTALDQRKTGDARGHVIGAPHLGVRTLSCRDSLHNIHGHRVAHHASPLILEHGPVTTGVEQAAGGRLGRLLARLQHGRCGGWHVHGWRRIERDAARHQQGRSKGTDRWAMGNNGFEHDGKSLAVRRLAPCALACAMHAT